MDLELEAIGRACSPRAENSGQAADETCMKARGNHLLK